MKEKETKFINLDSEKDKPLLLEQYRILSESLNKTNDNRESLNNFWIALNGVIFGAISYIKDMPIESPPSKNIFIWVAILFGFIMSLFWIKALSSIKKSIDIRNEMLVKIEQFLPAKIFTFSLNKLGRRKGKESLSSTEKSIPVLFCVGYALIAFLFLAYPIYF